MIYLSTDFGVVWPRDVTDEEELAILQAEDEDGNFLHFDPEAINVFFIHEIASESEKYMAKLTR